MGTWEIGHTVNIMLADYIIFRITGEHNPNGSKIQFFGNLTSKSRLSSSNEMYFANMAPTRA